MEKKYIEVKHFRLLSNEEKLRRMIDKPGQTFMPAYELLGSYIQSSADLKNAIDGEFDDIADMEPGTFLQLTVVTMEESEYKNLPEFQGY